MANSLILALVPLLLVAVVESRNMVKRQAGLNNQCNVVSMYVDSRDCSKYFKCDSFGYPILQQCQTGTIFNAETYRCDYPSAVHIGSTCQMPPRFGNSNHDNQCHNNTSLYVDSHDCSKYFQCDRFGSAIQHQCQTGTIFNRDTFICDYPSNVNTGNSCQMPPRFSNKNTINRCSNVITMYVDARDCSRYFTCDISRNPTLQQCPVGNIFNSATLRCDHPANVHTGNTCLMSPTNRNTINRCSNVITMYVDARDCSKYFTCDIFRNPTLQQCPVGNIFNSATLRCDHPANVHTGNTCLMLPTNRNTNNRCSNTVTMYVDARDCSKYFTCDIFRNPTLQQCPAHTIFNSATFRCDHPDNVNTGNTCQILPTNRNTNNQCSNTVTMYVDAHDCSRYFTCDIFRNPTLQQCPVGNLFNSATLRCDHPANVHTGNTCELPPTNRNTINRCSNVITMYVDARDCSRYFTCDIFRNPTLQQCPAHNIFNSATLRCDHPANVHSGNTCEMSPTNKNTNNRCSNVVTMYVDARDCSRYFTCDIFRNPTLQQCPVGNIFNSAILRCDHPANVNTGNTCLMPTTRTNTRCGPGVSMYVDPNDCSRYYECDTTGNAILKPCSPGTMFNDAIRQCDWPANVKGINCRKNTALNVKPTVDRLCASNPNGNNSEAFVVAHPTLCNAFYMCQAGITHDPCRFCGEGTYFAQGGSNCMHNVGDDTRSFCGNRRYIAHGDITQQTLSRECSAFTTGGLAGTN